MAISRILVVEDSVMLRRLACDMLRMAGYEVEEAADGTQALARLRVEPATLVLSDMNMAPMDGFDLLKAMRSDAGLAAIPFVLMSAEHTPETVTKAMGAGVDGMLAKPFGREQLTQKIASVLERPRQAA